MVIMKTFNSNVVMATAGVLVTALLVVLFVYMDKWNKAESAERGAERIAVPHGFECSWNNTAVPLKSVLDVSKLTHIAAADGFICASDTNGKFLCWFPRYCEFQP